MPRSDWGWHLRTPSEPAPRLPESVSPPPGAAARTASDLVGFRVPHEPSAAHPQRRSSRTAAGVGLHRAVPRHFSGWREEAASRAETLWRERIAEDSILLRTRVPGWREGGDGPPTKAALKTSRHCECGRMMISS